jgi:hypothetical protein
MLLASDHDPFHFMERNLIVAPVISGLRIKGFAAPNICA